MNSLFTFEVLYNLHFSVSRLVERSIVTYLCTHRFLAGGAFDGKRYLYTQAWVLSGCNVMVESIGGDGELPEI